MDNIIDQYISNVQYDSRLRDGMRYVLAGGKRLRPVLTVAVLQKLQPEHWQNLAQVCLIPEFIHCSSLIIDDLPAFDNGQIRREKRCVHLEFGEGLAYLLSFNLVTEAVMLIHKQLPHLKEVYSAEEAYKRCEEQIYNVTSNLSGSKALGGQLLSTFHTSGLTNLSEMGDTSRPPPMSREEICDILNKKTSSFFEIALTAGWLVGHGDIERMNDVKRLATLLGLCYQIYDDFMDYHQDTSGDHFSHNYVYHRGIETAMNEFLEYMEELRQVIAELGLECQVFDYILEFMNDRVLTEFKTLKPIVNGQ